VDEVGGGLDGLSQLRALMASGRKPGILVALDFELVQVPGGYAGHTSPFRLRLRRAFPSYGSVRLPPDDRELPNAGSVIGLECPTTASLLLVDTRLFESFSIVNHLVQ
jgi:hypothetical protein